ncbi:hypothetical protein NDU88_003521 [Pleurodeles waltl]|uniref:Uncharacterized protein n=1 Tax=Pleurodeles waltl TaxID=8319 RepID=A0AAV7T5L0_PLEWA|nr:hypothetical protein NDU88_003521 [Pleurodeles waltl]
MHIACSRAITDDPIEHGGHVKSISGPTPLCVWFELREFIEVMAGTVVLSLSMSALVPKGPTSAPGHTRFVTSDGNTDRRTRVRSAP